MTETDHQTLRQKDHQMLMALVESQNHANRELKELKDLLGDLNSRSMTKEELQDLKGILEGGRALKWTLSALKSTAGFITVMVGAVLGLITYFKWHTGP